MKANVLWIIGIFLSSNICFGDTYPKNPNIDIIHYAFDIRLSDETDLIKAKATLQVQFKIGGIDTVRLDLIKKSEKIAGKGMRVINVFSQGESVSYSHDSEVLWININPSVAMGEQTIVIQYEGVPANGLVIGPNKYGDRTFFSDNWPNKARNWLPTIDHPYDKATCEFMVTAPLRYQVVSNGLKVEESNIGEGMRLTHWKQSVPIPCWLYVLGVAEFAVQYVDTFKGRSIQTWVYKQDRINGFKDFSETTKLALTYFSNYIGPYAYEKLANVQSNSVKGGMEAASAILYHDNITGKRDESLRNIIVHELAHQWFGNAVTEYDWDDVWLSEGLTTYFTLRYIGHAYGKEAFIKGLKKAREAIFHMSINNGDYRIVHDNLSDMGKVTSGLTYQKGAWIAHMICNYIGEEAFQRGIREYYRRFMNSNATTLDLKIALEQASGKNLDTIFKQWLYRGGNPKLRGEWGYNAKTGTVTMEIDQVQSEQYLFDMPLEIGIVTQEKSPERIETMHLDKKHNTFSFKSNTMPHSIRLDPRTVLLAQWDLSRKKE